MPKKRFRSSKSEKRFIADLDLVFNAFIMPLIRIPKALFSRDTIKAYKYKRNMAIDIFALLVILFVLFTLGYSYFIVLSYIGYGIIGLVVFAITFRILRNRKIKKMFSHPGNDGFEISHSLRKALETMDSTGKWYNNEEEANRELVTCLKAQGISEVRYQYRLGNGRTADAKIGDCLIEGKLSPDTAEIDRLIGQISDYTQYANKLNVIVYGQFDGEARRRLENEIRSRYVNRVFLTYLNSPKRLRANP